MDKWDEPANSLYAGNKVWEVLTKAVNNVDPVSTGYVIGNQVVTTNEEIVIKTGDTLVLTLSY